jgi:hypothetical protein
LLVGAATGIGFTVTVVVWITVDVQPGMVLPAVNVYTAVAVGMAVGLAAVVVESAGPVQLKVLVLAPGLVDKFTVPPEHIGPLLLIVAVG